MASIAMLAGVEPRPPQSPGHTPHDITHAATDRREKGGGVGVIPVGGGGPEPISAVINAGNNTTSTENTVYGRSISINQHASGAVGAILQPQDGTGPRREKGNMGGNKGRHVPPGAAGNASGLPDRGQSVYMRSEPGWWNGDKSYYRQQVERLGFRFHQPGVAVPRRGHGLYRAAEGHNDLRALLAAQPVSHMGPRTYGAAPHQRDRRTKKINPACMQESSASTLLTARARAAAAQDQDGAAASSSSSAAEVQAPCHTVIPAVLNSDGVRDSLRQDIHAAGPTKGHGSGAAEQGGGLSVVRRQLGGISQRTFDAALQRREEKMAQHQAKRVPGRMQPSMRSTLPIGWEDGSSWNPDADARLRTSYQTQNAGERIGYRSNLEGTRRLGRNRSVLKSQIVLG